MQLNLIMFPFVCLSKAFDMKNCTVEESKRKRNLKIYFCFKLSYKLLKINATTKLQTYSVYFTKCKNFKMLHTSKNAFSHF